MRWFRNHCVPNAEDAGNPLVVKRYAGMIHGFHWMLGALDASHRLHEHNAAAATPLLTPVATA